MAKPVGFGVCAHSNQLAAPIAGTFPSNTKSYIDENMTVLLHTGDDLKVKRLFYVTVHSLMMGR